MLTDLHAAVRQVIVGDGDPVTALERFRFWQTVSAQQQGLDPALECAFAQDVMALYGSYSAADVAPWAGSMVVRAASRLRAQGQIDAPVELDICDHQTPFRGFFAVERFDVYHPRFDGTRSGLVRREIFVAVDAVTVLPYDARLDRVLVVEQLRMGPVARGDRQIHQIEAVAGRIDAGETPQQAAQRETQEEAGLQVSQLLEIAQYYPSPGAMSEYLYSYLALCDLPGMVGQTDLFGLASEGEDIRTHLWSFDQAMAAVRAGQIRNGPLLVSLMWLAAERVRLRAL